MGALCDRTSNAAQVSVVVYTALVFNGAFCVPACWLCGRTKVRLSLLEGGQEFVHGSELLPTFQWASSWSSSAGPQQLRTGDSLQVEEASCLSSCLEPFQVILYQEKR